MVDGPAHPLDSPSPCPTLGSEDWVMCRICWRPCPWLSCSLALGSYVLNCSLCLALDLMQFFSFYNCWHLFAFAYLVHWRTGYFLFPLCSVTMMTDSPCFWWQLCKTWTKSWRSLSASEGRKDSQFKEAGRLSFCCRLEWYNSSK